MPRGSAGGARRSANDLQPIHRCYVLFANLQRIDLEREAIPWRRRCQRTEPGKKVSDLLKLTLG